MSFVYAEKRTVIDQEVITIHCDTKIGLSDDAKANFSVKEIDLIKKYGIVKISILGSAISVAFAGNKIFLASKLFSQLCEMKSFSIEEAVERAYEIHKSAEQFSDIEFIICCADDNTLQIACVKDGNILHDCSSAWLGSYNAFREFQKIRHADSTKSPIEMTTTAFESVVQGCEDDSVGGLHLSASYRPDLKSFWYSEKKCCYSVKKQFVDSGDNIRFYLDASDGGFSYQQIPFDYQNLLIEIGQMEPMILYSSQYRVSEMDIDNPNLFGLMLPILVKQKNSGEIVMC